MILCKNMIIFVNYYLDHMVFSYLNVDSRMDNSWVVWLYFLLNKFWLLHTIHIPNWLHNSCIWLKINILIENNCHNPNTHINPYVDLLDHLIYISTLINTIHIEDLYYNSNITISHYNIILLPLNLAYYPFYLLSNIKYYIYSIHKNIF